MYTSAIKTGMKYLAASIIIAAAAAVYGLFSHGVYSYFMTYAFMIPLIAGALPHLAAAMRSADAGSGERDTYERPGNTECETHPENRKVLSAKDLQLALIVTLTAGSLLKGVLDIYGTTNRLLMAYPVIAAAMLAAAAVTAVKNKTEKN